MASEIVESLPLKETDTNFSTITANKIHFLNKKGCNTIIDSTTTNDSLQSNHGKIIAAMPAFNEEKFIGKTVVGCKPYVDEVIVINDGSTDATAMIATACGATVVYHEQNMGYGASIRSCFETAKKMQVTAMVILDADGQHDPLDIQQVLQPILNNEADVCIGSRFLKNHTVKVPFYRKIGMKVLDFATNQGGDIKITDTQSGFRAYSANAINKIRIENTGMAAGSEILLQLKDQGLKIEEVPITCRYDIEDTSTHNPVFHGMKVLANIISEIEYKHPLFYIGLPGVLLFCAGLVIGGMVINSYNSNGYVPFGPAILMVLLFMVGSLAIFSALNLHATTQLLKKMKSIQ